MRRFLSLSIAFFMWSILYSQSNFMEHIESKVSGQGTVTVFQDQRLTDIINGVTPVVKASDAASKSDGKTNKTGRKVKARGYRIQVYWGGTQRADQQKAIAVGEKISTLFPELETYTTFESPHWRCRVGDFITRKEALEYLNKMQEMNMATDAMIVRSDIILYR